MIDISIIIFFSVQNYLRKKTAYIIELGNNPFEGEKNDTTSP